MKRNLDGGDGDGPNKSQPNTNASGTIKVHSLSSEEPILVPETPSVSVNPLPLSTSVSPRTSRTAFTSSRPVSAVTLGSSLNSRHCSIRPYSGRTEGGGGGGSSRSSFLGGSSASACARNGAGVSSIELANVGLKDAERLESLLRRLFHEEKEVDYEEGEEGRKRDSTEETQKYREASESLYDRYSNRNKEGKLGYSYKLYFGRISELLPVFALLPVPPGCNLRCRITRVGGTIMDPYAKYYMYLDREGGGNDILLLSAKRKNVVKSTYVITTNPADFSKHSPHCVGILEGNYKGSDFLLKAPYQGDFLDVPSTPRGGGREKSSPVRQPPAREWEQLLSVNYEPSPMGVKGPRKLSILLPKLKSDWERAYPGSFGTSPNRFLVNLKNKTPNWRPSIGIYTLNFGHRVRLSSVKNFQLVHPDHDVILLQFGRREGNHEFILDFQSPFCPVQAFAAALTNFDVKFGLD